MPTNPQIEARLKRQFREITVHNREFNAMMSEEIQLKTEVEPQFCYLPEFKVGEQYRFIDERKRYVPTQWYLKHKRACEKAVNSVCNNQGNVILNRKSTYRFLLQNKALYSTLYEDWNFRAFYRFRYIYYFVIDFVDFYQKGFKARMALKNFNPYNEDDLIDWLIDYNRLLYCEMMGKKDSFTLVDEENDLYQLKTELYTFYVQGVEITECIRFCELYQNYEKIHYNQVYKVD